MNQYSNSLFPLAHSQKKRSSGAKAMVDTLCFYSLFGFVAGLAILLVSNLYLFS